MKTHERGQALAETAVTSFMMTFGLVMLFSGIRYGIIDERSAMTARSTALYVGNTTPYVNYSFDASYNALKNVYSSPNTQSPCTVPAIGNESNSSTYGQLQTSAFWQTGTTTTSCSASLVKIPNISETDSSLWVQQYTVTTTVQAPPFVLDSLRMLSGTISNQITTYQPASLNVLIHCTKSIGTIVQASIYPPIPNPNPPMPQLMTDNDALQYDTSIDTSPKACAQLPSYQSPYTIGAPPP